MVGLLQKHLLMTLGPCRAYVNFRFHPSLIGGRHLQYDGLILISSFVNWRIIICDIFAILSCLEAPLLLLARPNPSSLVVIVSEDALNFDKLLLRRIRVQKISLLSF